MNRRPFVGSLLAPTFLSACFGAQSDDTEPRASSLGERVRVTPTLTEEPRALTIYAATSLTLTFDRLIVAFRQSSRHGDVSVTKNYGASSQLRAQLVEGAPADLFASADRVQMDLAVAASVIAQPVHVFAHNRLIAIAARNLQPPLTSLTDLARPGLRIVTAPIEVPIGAYMRTALRKMAGDEAFGPDFVRRVLANVVSEEANVRQLVAKVQIGEADAAICYATDVNGRVAAEVVTIEIPDAFNVVADYPIAIVRRTKSPTFAREFLTFIRAPAGATMLSADGFQPVPFGE